MHIASILVKERYSTYCLTSPRISSTKWNHVLERSKYGGSLSQYLTYEILQRIWMWRNTRMNTLTHKHIPCVGVSSTSSSYGGTSVSFESEAEIRNTSNYRYFQAVWNVRSCFVNYNLPYGRRSASTKWWSTKFIIAVERLITNPVFLRYYWWASTHLWRVLTHQYLGFNARICTAKRTAVHRLFQVN